MCSDNQVQRMGEALEESEDLASASGAVGRRSSKRVKSPTREPISRDNRGEICESTFLIVDLASSAIRWLLLFNSHLATLLTQP